MSVDEYTPAFLEQAIENEGIAISVMPGGLKPTERADWLRSACRAIDLVTASRDDLVVGALPPHFLGLPHLAGEYGFIVFIDGLDLEDAREKFEEIHDDERHNGPQNPERPH